MQPGWRLAVIFPLIYPKGAQVSGCVAMQRVLLFALLVLMVSGIAHAVQDAGSPPCGSGTYDTGSGHCIK
jgi:hypothetical protein